MDKLEATAFADQLSAAIRDVIAEKGYDVEISIATDIGGAMAFSVESKNRLITKEVIEEVLNEAASRIGCKHEC